VAKKCLLFFRANKIGLARFGKLVMVSNMTHLASLPKPQLLELLAQQTQTLADRDTELQAKKAELQSKGSELESQREQLRQQDIALQTKDQTIEQLTQERDEYKLAFDKLVQQRFRNRSERYLENPDQLRLDFGDTAEAADAALGLAEAVDDAQIIPEHRRRKPRKKRDEQLPEHLPRYEVTAEASDETKSCPTHGERTLLPESMWDRTESRRRLLTRRSPARLTASEPCFPSRCGTGPNRWKSSPPSSRCE
jgi:Skp family chaperone for outer membrane proteins